MSLFYADQNFHPLEHDPQVLLRETLSSCDRIQATLIDLLEKSPQTAISKMLAHKPDENPLRVFDSIAEEWIRNDIKAKFSEPIDVYGEEDPRLPTANFTSSATTVLLVDMVDGSDLLMNGLGNWCSAVVAFSPLKKKILAVVVAHSNGDRYCATQDSAFVEKPIERASREIRRRKVDLAVNQNVKGMSGARVCCYGQKWKRVLSASHSFYSSLGDRGRFYNLAGNPMMALLAEGKIDAVFDIGGQKAYNVVPGACIALKAGAVMSTPEGKMIEERDLYNQLLIPNREMRYVLAATDDLRRELCDRLSGASILEDKH